MYLEIRRNIISTTGTREIILLVYVKTRTSTTASFALCLHNVLHVYVRICAIMFNIRTHQLITIRDREEKNQTFAFSFLIRSFRSVFLLLLYSLSSLKGILYSVEVCTDQYRYILYTTHALLYTIHTCRMTSMCVCVCVSEYNFKCFSFGDWSSSNIVLFMC